MRIGELAERAGVTPRTIRYYEKLQLLGPSERTGRGFRYYTEAELARLKKIDTLKELGLSLEEIQSVIDLYFAEADGALQGQQKILQILEQHLRDTESRIADLVAFRADLQANIARMRHWIAETERS
jgi:MerR family copper efflux transcriptional regulator